MLILLFMACQNEAGLRADFNAVQCQTLERCDDLQALGYSDVDDCITRLDAATAEEEPCGDSFNADNATICIEGWDALACETLATEQPAECQTFCEASAEATD